MSKKWYLPLVLLGGLGVSCSDDDGVDDPCEPNPCTEAHRTVCTAEGDVAVCSCDPGWVDDGSGGCVQEVCDPACATGMHCESGTCVSNECVPPCGPGEICVEHGADACQCGTGGRCTTPETCVGGQCVSPCADGLDNDGDGWIDAADPDCTGGSEEVGLGQTQCNDGQDNDTDGFTDAADPDCEEATHDDESSGGPLCADECLYGETRNGGAEVCDLWDAVNEVWLDIGDGATSTRNRARLYSMWLRRHLLPAGGVANGVFTDTGYTDIQAWGGTGDSAIWTGTYLAAEALKCLTTGSDDAESQVNALVETLHHWFRISGDPGYLARFAAPTTSDPRVLAVFEVGERREHFDVSYNGGTWHWTGHISRDQYQGVMLGYALAYECTSDAATRETIRQDVVEFVEQLMRSETKQVYITSLGYPVPITMQYSVFTDDETTSGNPELDLDTSNYEDSEIWGFQEFHPDPAQMFRQIPLMGWLPSIPRAGSAIMLTSFFEVALRVTEGEPAYATRRQAISDHFDQNVSWWLDFAEQWSESLHECGDKYYGYNIAFEPMYNLARLEADPALSARIRQNVLAGRMWPVIGGHKNPWFAFIYAANQPWSSDLQAIIDNHADQLALFPIPPRVNVSVDLTGEYPPDPDCPGNSTEAVDVDDRCPSDFIWQRHPWKMIHTGNPLVVYPGVDYLAAYWLGRYHGFVADDLPDTCLAWRTL